MSHAVRKSALPQSAKKRGNQIEISFDTMKQIGHEMQDAPDVVRQNEVEERILDFRMGPGGFSASAIEHNAGCVSVLGATLLEQAGAHPLFVEDHAAIQVCWGTLLHV